MLHELTNEICEVDAAFTRQHGRTHWRFYDPAYYEPMMAIRRAAFAAGEDPDAAVAAHPELCSL
jgi:ABC-type glycerol-3-phosphate transport system substrate-binding protein